MKTNKTLQVFYKEQLVGTLAMTRNQKAAFSYSDSWIEHGFSLNPFSLPLEKRVFVPVKDYFTGLFGCFADSLPDTWGTLLLDRLLEQHGISRDQLNILDRLAIVGHSGMGALTYQPEILIDTSAHTEDLDTLEHECQKILHAEYSENLDQLYQLGGTSGGARPKIMTTIEQEEWIIKFPAHIDSRESGRMEYEYSLCARQCGISMTETRLFPSRNCSGYFGTKRFDRNPSGGKIHMLTVAALLELDYRQPSLDYHSLMKLTKLLTGNDPHALESMFRRMCFNVFAHNRDDHSKNFSYLYDEKNDLWSLSPAYDLTWSSTYYGEHTTTVDGNGQNPGKKELLNVGLTAGMKRKICENIIEEIHDCVKNTLDEWI